MLKWFSNDEAESGSGAPGYPHGSGRSEAVQAEEMADRLVQTQQLVTQLKELIREKDATLCTKDEQLKMEKEACEDKLSKLHLQNKAKVTSLTTQLEELKKRMQSQDSPTRNKKGPSEGGDQATRGRIILLKKKVEELEEHLAQSEKEIERKRTEVEAQQLRGEEMDAMLTEKDRKLAEKEAYIIHLQTATAVDQSVTSTPQVDEDHGAMHELQQLVQSLTKKVGETEERYSLLQEQTDSLKELLDTEKEQYSQKENMYKQNIQTFKEIILQKDNQLTEINQMHEQELFKLAAKSDASADLEQLLKALKQKLHEKEEVLIGKAQVIDVLQKEVDGRDQQIKELTERMRRLNIERESLESKMEAEKHVMRAQLRDLMEKQQVEIRQMTEKHQAQLTHTQQDLLGQLNELRRNKVTLQSVSQESPKAENISDDSASFQRIAELEAQTKQKIEEASRSEAKFLKMKAWSKSRIRQLEEELKKSQAGIAPPDLTALRSQITELEVEREENLWKVEQYEELKAKNDMLEAKLEVYEEQQRTLQADLEQFTKRATSQASESGSADDAHSQVLEWQEMVDEAVSARDQAREEKAAMVLRITHMEEEREALATRQQELEEELAQAQGLSQHGHKKLTVPAQRSMQEDFEFDGKASFHDYHSTSESTTPMEGENMGGWWPEYSTPDTGGRTPRQFTPACNWLSSHLDGLRTVVEELELERNQLQEQILSLEERCQGLEDRLQLQARFETLQNETDKLQAQLASVRSQQNREAEKHQLLVRSLNEQLKGLRDTQECLESSLIEKESALAKTSEKLELINSLKESSSEKGIQCKEMSNKLLQTEQALENVSKKSSISEKLCSELKAEVTDVTQRLSELRDKSQKQDIIIDTLQTELDQTNEELDKLNTSHLEERAQLIHDLQSCEREIDSLKDTLLEKDKALNTTMLEYSEQVTVLKEELRLKEENLIQVENALTKAGREVTVISDSQTADQQSLNTKITELVENLKDVRMELDKAKEESKSKVAEMDQLIKQAKENKQTIQDLRSQTQKQTVSHHVQLSECETLISSLKEQMELANLRQHESDELMLQLKEINANNEKNILQKEEMYENELKTIKDEKNKLLSQVEKFNHDMELLSKELKERAQSKDNVQQEMEKYKKIITLLENQLKANDEQAKDERQSYNAELQVRESENKKLRKELDNNIENVSNMKDLLKHMETEKEQLQEKLINLTENLEVQNLNENQLNENITSALELNNNLKRQVQNLTKENERLELEVTEKVATISEIKFERDSLHAKLSTLESQYFQNSSMIHELEKNKEDLILQATDLKRDLKQHTLSNNEVVLAKTKECSNLNRLLREKEDIITQLQGQLQSHISEADELRVTTEKNHQVASDLQAELEARKIDQMQLKETLTLLQAQDCSLKSGLLEKDSTLKEKQEECHGLQSEIIFHKESVQKLQEEVESLNSERSQFCKDLEEKEMMMKSMAQQCQKHKDDFDDANNNMNALKNEINEMKEKSRKLKTEANFRETELRTLKSKMHTIMSESQQLHAVLKSIENELDKKTHIISNLDTELKATLEQNSSFSMNVTSLTEDNERLQKEVSQNNALACELKTKISLLKEQKSKLEEQNTNDEKIINDLLNEKKYLIDSVSNTKQVIQEREISNKVCLLEKTNECNTLSKTLNEREQQIQTLQEQVNDLKIQINQLKLSLVEKEEILLEEKSLLEAQHIQQLQLQDTISMLQEQGSILKTEIMEKDTMLQQKSDECIVHHNEVMLQKDLVLQMQCEVESVRQESLETKQQLEQKEHMLKDLTNDFENQQEELNECTQSMIKLESQLAAVNNGVEEMQIEITNLKDSVETLTFENCQLRQENELMKAEVTDLKDAIQALNDQNVSFKSELQKSCVELSKAHEELAHLKKAVNESELQLKTTQSEKEHLNLTIQDKDDSLKELKSRISEQEEQLKLKDNEMFSLKVQVTDLGDSVCKLRGQIRGLTSESTTLKNILEKKEQSSLEDQRNVTLVNENLNVSLQDKEKECEILKEKLSHLEEESFKINSILQMQIVETKNLEKALEERDFRLMDQSQSLQGLQRTADELLLFKSQFVESTELMSQLQNQIQILSSDASNHKTSAEEKQSALINLQEKYAANLEDLQDMRKQLSQRTDEMLSLKTLSDEHNTAKTTIETLRNELSLIQNKLEKTQNLISKLSKEKDEAFASHQANVSHLTVEIEKLRAQHLQVVGHMNALTENLEQREMALHAINNQYTAQAKHTSDLISKIQKLELQNKKLNEEISLSRKEHQSALTAVNNENIHLVEDIRKLLAEKEGLEKLHHQICESKGDPKVQLEQQSSSISESIQQMVYDKESLQTKKKMENLQTQLKTEEEKSTEASLKHLSLHGELKIKDDQINSMTIQISQQKELLIGLSQQLKEKDASISQVMESALNERVKLGEENDHLAKQLAIIQQDYDTSTKQYKEIFLQLEEHNSCTLRENEIQNSEKLELLKQNSDLKCEIANISKEKDTVKKKLQVSFIIRKDLLKKNEESEKKCDGLDNDISCLQDKLVETTTQAQSAAKVLDERIALLEKECFDKEREIHYHKMQTEELAEQLESEKNFFHSSESETESCLTEILQQLNEKRVQIQHLQACAAEQQNSFEQEKRLIENVEEHQIKITICKNLSKDKAFPNDNAGVLENKLAQMKQEKALLQKKIQVALLARKETLQRAQENEKQLTKELNELKDNYKALLKQHCQQPNELTAIQFKYNENLSELEQLQRTSLSNLDELKILRELVQKDETVQDLKISLAESERQCHSKLQTQLKIKDKALILMEERSETLASNSQPVTIIEQGQLKTNEVKFQDSMEEKTHLDQVSTIQRVLAEAQQRLCEKEYSLTRMLEKAQLEYTEKETNLVSLNIDNVNALRIIDELKIELGTLHTQLNQCKHVKELMYEEIAEASNKEEHVNEDAVNTVDRCAEDLQTVPKHEDKSAISEKDELIAALQLQLQQISKNHDISTMSMKRENDQLHQSQEDCGKVNNQDNHNKMTLLTKKLQTALVSRKELMKENASLKEQVGNLSSKINAKEVECLALESSFSRLKQQNVVLEIDIKSVNTDKEKLSSEVDRIHHDNCSLSDACESLKQTIENITQQKQAFSCQLESLKDSQTEELTKWKSMHSELEQDYETLLQAYENVGTEMDKMRQHLEGAKSDRQEALRKLLKCETEMVFMHGQARQVEEEHETLKEKMQTFSEEKQHIIEELQQENDTIKKELVEIIETHRIAIFELTNKNQHCEAKILQLKSSLEACKDNIADMHVKNRELTEKLNGSDSKQCMESKSHAKNVQLKLDETLSEKNVLITQIEGQNAEFMAQLESNKVLLKENTFLSERLEKIHSSHEVQLQIKEDAIIELQAMMNQHIHETISLNEKVKILEDDKCLLQEELENVQESSDRVKNENEYLETVVLNNSKIIESLSESISALQAQNIQLSSQLAISKEVNDTLCQEKQDGHLKLIQDVEEKLKAVQREKEGSKNTNKELQELLKEKHQEISQLQQNCIKYQEHILHLENSLKTMKKVEEQNKEGEAKSHIQEATVRTGMLQERDHLKLDRVNVPSEDSLTGKTKLKEATVEKQLNSFKNNEVILQKQMDDLKNLDISDSRRVTELKRQMDYQAMKMNNLKRAFETNEAKLSALSSTPHGANATKLWNDLYQNALQEKDNQLMEQGSAVKKLLEDMRLCKKEVNELKIINSRLKSALNGSSVASASHQRQMLILSASNADLNETVELLTVQLNELSAQAKTVEQDQSALEMQIANNDEISHFHLHNLTEKINADLDAEMLVLRAENDKVQADLENQKGISLQLESLLQSKDAEISSLLSCRDDHMSGYIEQLQANCQSQEAIYEDRLRTLQHQREQATKEFRELQAKVRSLQISLNRSGQEKEQVSAKMEEVKMSLVSAQREKEQLMSEYRILEAKSHLELKDEENSIDNGGTTRGLKEEIKKLLYQMDDLNSENAMLRAQLIHYREDLNQVLSLKDNQLKVLLKKQEDVIQNLENQNTTAEKQHTEALSELQNEIEMSCTLKADVSKLETQVAKLQNDIASQKDTNEDKVIADLQRTVAAKTAECIDLQQKLLSQEAQIADITKQMDLLENETDKKLTHSDDEYNTELDASEHEVDQMTTERQRAEQKFAKGLLESEQQLLEAQGQNKDLKAQNESLCKAMAALQNDRDQLVEDFKVLRSRYDGELRDTWAALNKVERHFQDATSDVAMFTKEREILVHKLRALESKDTHAELNKLLGELTKAFSEKEKQLKRVILENSSYSKQLSAFSKSIASLQNDRDRLVDELAEATKVIESRQESGLNTVRTMSETKSKGSTFQIEKHGVMKELQPRLTPGKEASNLPNETALQRSERDTQPVKEMVNPVSQKEMEEAVSRLEAERVQLHRELQLCLYDIQQRDQYFEQLNSKLQQAMEEKGAVTAHLSAMSQTLSDTQNRCRWLESQGQTQGAVEAQVAPGGPQEKNSTVVAQTIEVDQLRERLLEVERSLADERYRRETAEEALHLAEASTKSSSLSQDLRRDFSSIEMEADDEWEAVSLNPNQPLITRKMKGGMVACRRWFRGRGLYFSRLLMSRARSRYFFLAYLVAIHVLVLMCLTGAL
ncbi:golgin subfamily B member 1 isoform X4 [Syngnathus scovelli]|uniref:golgin subfamily B member 1 isoform X4 n=1 Tax=Syngnathus scovelli TaxID=161590 RepID=UPI002110951F|nr:golgin subfamily B member 1 isoform X4 [Syngnathus scovelli]